MGSGIFFTAIRSVPELFSRIKFLKFGTKNFLYREFQRFLFRKYSLEPTKIHTSNAKCSFPAKIISIWIIIDFNVNLAGDWSLLMGWVWILSVTNHVTGNSNFFLYIPHCGIPLFVMVNHDSLIDRKGRPKMPVTWLPPLTSKAPPPIKKRLNRFNRYSNRLLLDGGTSYDSFYMIHYYLTPPPSTWLIQTP